MNGHLSEEELILVYYREPEAPSWAGSHLNSCPACRRAAGELAEALALCSEFEVPEPGPEYGRSAWARLAPALEDGPPRTRSLWHRGWTPAWGLALACAVLIAAFIAGRVTGPQRQPAITAGLSAQARQRILAIALADHLERAGMVLTEIANEGEPSAQRTVAEDLVDEGHLLRQSLAASGGSATLEIVDEVERILVDVANAPDLVDPTEARRLRERLDSGSLLFKVRVLETNLYKDGRTI